jgi:hypothetical protein
MRATQKRTVEDAWRYIGSLARSIEPREYSNHFSSADTLLLKCEEL